MRILSWLSGLRNRRARCVRTRRRDRRLRLPVTERLEERALLSVVSITTADGNGADAFVRAGAFADANFGAETELLVKHDVSLNDFTRKTYLRFDLSQLSGADPQDARLKLTVANPDCDAVTFNLFGLNDGDAGENWNEATLSWNNAPGNDSASQSGMNGSATLLGTFTVDAAHLGEVVSLASAGLVTFLQADTDGRATLMLTRQGPPTASNTGSQDFAAKEHSTLDAPLLDLTIVEAGGPYFAVEGGAVSLAGSGRTTNAGPYSFEWDLDGDGAFGETGAGAARGNETGATPTFHATGLDGPTAVTVTLRVTDTSAGSATDTATINVTNAAPSASIGGTLIVNEGSLLALTGATRVIRERARSSRFRGISTVTESSVRRVLGHHAGLRMCRTRASTRAVSRPTQTMHH